MYIRNEHRMEYETIFTEQGTNHIPLTTSAQHIFFMTCIKHLSVMSLNPRHGISTTAGYGSKMMAVFK